MCWIKGTKQETVPVFSLWDWWIDFDFFLLLCYSDSVMLKNDCFQEFYQLNYLQHLSLSRCYDIIPETLL